MKHILNLLAALLPFCCFAQNHADCDSAYRVCDKNPLHFAGQSGEGAVMDAEMIGCFLNSPQVGKPEKNSVWLRFDIKESGTVSFVIVPDTLSDDIDFVVFALPRKGDCAGKRVVRCMAAGDKSENYDISPCMGATGLNELEKDESEDSGCADKDDNNWLAPLQARSGEQYVLLVSNTSAAYNGFKIQFGGTATFACDAKKE